MSNYSTSEDLVDDILFRSGEPTDGSSDFNAVALKYLNRGYDMLLAGGNELDPIANEQWWWQRKRGVLTLEPYISTGTVNVTRNSTSITFSSAPASSVAGWHIKFGSDPTVYMIASHTGGVAAATLDGVYVEQNNTAIEYKLMKLEYTLAADLMDLTSPFKSPVSNERGHYTVYGMSLDALERQYPLNLILQGVPCAFAQLSDTTVRFSSFVDDYLRLDYEYQYLPTVLTDSSASIPIIPAQYRRILSDIGTYFVMMDKNDNRADAAMLAAKQLMKAMITEQRARLIQTGQVGKIQPRRPASGRPYGVIRTESGMILG